MNTIRNIRESYNISNAELSVILNVNKNTVPIMLDRDIKTLSINQLIALHESLKQPYNILLGEQVFTLENIDNQTNQTKHTSLSDHLITINENEIHLHPSFVEAIRSAIRNDKE